MPTVPNLLGLSAADADAATQTVGLVLDAAAVAVGANVSRQSPHPQSEVADGSPVVVGSTPP